jgi:rhodanese-related sulfurtransferase
MRMQTVSTSFAFFILLFSGFSANADEVISENVDIHTFSALITEHSGDANSQIIDVRTPKEFHASHIVDAHLIDFYAKGFFQKLEQLDKDKTYLLYCRSGNRSGKTLKIMKKMGFKSAYNMQGGMKAWTRANYPVVTAK